MQNLTFECSVICLVEKRGLKLYLSKLYFTKLSNFDWLFWSGFGRLNLKFNKYLFIEDVIDTF